MKKRTLILMAMVICTITLCGCRETRLSEKRNNEVRIEGNTGQSVVYDKISDMDFITGHIKGVLKENFKVDADVPTNIPDKMWYYEIYNKEKEEKSKEEYTEYLAKLVDQYYGEDITITANEEKESIMHNIFFDGSEGYFFKTSLEMSSNYMRMAMVDESFPEYGQYNKEFIDPIVGEFREKMAAVIPDGTSEGYICVYFDEEYRNYINEKYGNNSPFEFEWAEDLGNYYIVRLYSKIGGYDFKIDGNFFMYSLEEGCTYDDVYRVSEKNDSIGYAGAACCSPQYVDIIINEEGEVLGFNIFNHYEIGKAIEEKNILSAQEILELFYSEFENVILRNEIIVTDLQLHYTMVLDEPDENGYRNAFLTPVWHIFVYNESYGTYATRICSAVDGRVYKKDNLLIK